MYLSRTWRFRHCWTKQDTGHMSYMPPYGPAPHKSFVAQWLEHPTGVPKVIVSSPSTSLSGFSLLLQERTLVAAGHVETCVNKLRSGGRSPTKFCRVDDEILSRVLGRKFLSKNGAWLLSCVQTVLLSTTLFYNNNNNNNNNNLWTYCVQLNMRMISCALQLHFFTRNK